MHAKIAFLFLVCLALAACTTAPTPAPTRTTVPTSTPSPHPTSSATSTSTITPVPTETPTQTPIPNPSLLPPGASAQLGKGEITTLALSPDRSLLAVGSRAGVCLYGVDRYTEIWCDRTPIWRYASWVRTLAFRPQGDVLAAGMTGGQVVLWDVNYGSRLAERTFSHDFINSLAWSPDGARLAIGSNYVEIASWDGAELEPDESPRHSPTFITALSWSPDGNRLVWGEITSYLVLWDLAAGEAIAKLELGNTDQTHAFFWTMGGELIVVHGRFLGSGCCYEMGGGVTVLDPQTGAIIRDFDSLLWFDQENDLTHAALSPDGTLLAVGGGYTLEEGVAILNLETGERLASLPGAKRETGVAWVTESLLVTVQGQTLVEWDWQAGTVTPLSGGYHPPASAAAWSPDGARLASAHSEYYDQVFRIVIWDPQTGVALHTLRRDAGVAQVWWAGGGTELMWGEAGTQVFAWSPEGGEPRLVADIPHTRYVVEASPDGARLAVADAGAVSLWDLASGERLYAAEVDGEIGCLAWSQDGSRLALCQCCAEGSEGTIPILNALTGELETTIRPEFSVQKLAWSADGTQLAGSMGGWLAGWDVQSRRQLWKTGVDADGRPIASVAWSPVSNLLVSGGQDVSWWDAPRLLFNAPLAAFTGQGTPIYGVLFSPDGGRLASLSEDGTIVVWETP